MNTRVLRSLLRAAGAAVCVAGLAAAAAGQTKPGSTPPVVPENATVLEGTPSVRIDATSEGATRRQLGGSEAAKEALRIRIVDGRYFWESRENRPMTLSALGDFVYLSSTDPGRYVRFRRLNDRIAYVEHLDTDSGSVTYWGELRIVLGK